MAGGGAAGESLREREHLPICCFFFFFAPTSLCMKVYLRMLEIKVSGGACMQHARELCVRITAAVSVSAPWTKKRTVWLPPPLYK